MMQKLKYRVIPNIINDFWKEIFEDFQNLIFTTMMTELNRFSKKFGLKTEHVFIKRDFNKPFVRLSSSLILQIPVGGGAVFERKLSIFNHRCDFECEKPNDENISKFSDLDIIIANVLKDTFNGEIFICKYKNSDGKEVYELCVQSENDCIKINKVELNKLEEVYLD